MGRAGRILFGLAAVALVVAGWLFLRPCRPVEPRVRAIWVTRFDYTTPGDVRRIVGNVAKAGFTDLFFQIRGNATSFYRSRLEPWAFELTGGNVSSLGTDPGWDPLQVAIDTAHAGGIRIHAYMNVLPGWRGLEDPPADAGQLWTAHPNWFMVDSLGKKMLPTAGWYAFVNPVLPEVRTHLCGIVRELCRYDVDGIHLDYIRYPEDYRLVAAQRYPDASEEEILRHSDFSYDPVSQAELFERYGWKVTGRQIKDFRRGSVTRVVREIGQTVRTNRPGCILSACVMGNPTAGRNDAYQDSGAWVRGHLVDWAVQMNYGTASFDRYLKAIRKVAGRAGYRRAVVVGINCEHDADEVLAQIGKAEASCARGYALFSYSALFGKDGRPTEKGRIILAKIRP